MNLKSKYIIIAGLLVGMTGCDDKLETYEMAGSVATPIAIEASEVSSEALPGQIKLSWKEPAEKAFDYLQIKYNDPLTKKDVCKIASVGTTEMLINETRARFGDYSFYFQTFNAAHQGSAVTEVKAKSGEAPTTTTEVSRTKVELTGDQLSTDNQEPTEGPVKNLVDGVKGGSSFFHTRWSSPQVPLPQYIQIDFNEEHEIFAIQYTTRQVGNSDGFPTAADLQISQDGVEWETVASLSGLPAKSFTDYVSDFFIPGKKFKHFRFLVTSASANVKYFHMSEFEFYDVEIEVYNPETVPLD